MVDFEWGHCALVTWTYPFGNKVLTTKSLFCNGMSFVLAKSIYAALGVHLNPHH